MRTRCFEHKLGAIEDARGAAERGVVRLLRLRIRRTPRHRAPVVGLLIPVGVVGRHLHAVGKGCPCGGGGGETGNREVVQRAGVDLEVRRPRGHRAPAGREHDHAVPVGRRAGRVGDVRDLERHRCVAQRGPRAVPDHVQRVVLARRDLHLQTAVQNAVSHGHQHGAHIELGRENQLDLAVRVQSVGAGKPENERVDRKLTGAGVIRGYRDVRKRAGQKRARQTRSEHNKREYKQGKLTQQTSRHNSRLCLLGISAKTHSARTFGGAAQRTGLVTSATA